MKFSEEQLLKIKSLWKEGCGYRKIASQLNLSNGDIRNAYEILGINKTNSAGRKRILKDIPEEKVCPDCKILKNISEFWSRIKNGRKYYDTRCLICKHEHEKKQRNTPSMIQWKTEYREQHREQNKVRDRWRRKNEPVYRFRKIVSCAINRSIKGQGSFKFGKSFTKHLGYSILILVSHIESLFEPWMNWTNHGSYNSKTWNDNDSSTWTWQIDHIIPQSKLPYDSMEHPNFKKCWALDNLRPLSAKENLLKGNR